MLKLWEQAMVHIKALDHFELSLSGKEEVELPKRLAKGAIISFISGKECTTLGSVKDQQCSICLDDKDGSEMFTVSSMTCRLRRLLLDIKNLEGFCSLGCVEHLDQHVWKKCMYHVRLEEREDAFAM